MNAFLNTIAVLVLLMVAGFFLLVLFAIWNQVLAILVIGAACALFAWAADRIGWL